MKISLKRNEIVESIGNAINSKKDLSPDIVFIHPDAYRILDEVFMPELKAVGMAFNGVLMHPSTFSNDEERITFLKIIWDEE